MAAGLDIGGRETRIDGSPALPSPEAPNGNFAREATGDRTTMRGAHRTVSAAGTFR